MSSSNSANAQTPFVLRGGIVVSADAAPQPIDILCEGGKVAAIMAPETAVAEGVTERRIDSLHVFPGLIDAHVHFGFGEKITEYSTESKLNRLKSTILVCFTF